jgi:hypothetical protein
MSGAEGWAKRNGYGAGVLNPGTGQMAPSVPAKYGLVSDVTPGASDLRLHLQQAKVDMALG